MTSDDEGGWYLPAKNHVGLGVLLLALGGALAYEIPEMHPSTAGLAKLFAMIMVSAGLLLVGVGIALAARDGRHR